MFSIRTSLLLMLVVSARFGKSEMPLDDTAKIKVVEPRMTEIDQIYDDLQPLLVYDEYDHSVASYSCEMKFINSISRRFEVRLVASQMESANLCKTEINFILKNPTNYSKTFQFLTLFEEVSVHLENCDDEYLIFEQNGARQRYCNGTFYLTELPSQNLSLSVEYYSKRPKEILLPFVVKREMDKIYFKGVDGKYLDYTTPHIDYRSKQGDELYTYDPQYSDYQICPRNCGLMSEKLSRTYRDPALENYAGGNAIDFYDQPWFVRVVIHFQTKSRMLSRRCAGSILNSRTILTAATCFNNQLFVEEPMEYSGVTVYSGDMMAHIDDPYEQKILGESYIIHPEFDPYGGVNGIPVNNVAIIHLANDIRLGYTASPVCLAPPANYNHSMTRIIGFQNHLDNSERLRMTSYILGSNNNCEESEESICGIPHTFKEEEMHETCGEEGSPVMILLRNTWYQVAMISKIDDCGDLYKKEYGSVRHVLTNLTVHHDFINEHIFKGSNNCN